MKNNPELDTLFDRDFRLYLRVCALARVSTKELIAELRRRGDRRIIPLLSQREDSNGAKAGSDEYKRDS